MKGFSNNAGLIKEMSKIDMERGEITPLRTFSHADAPLSATVAKDLTTNKDHAYFISYAGAPGVSARVLSFHTKQTVMA